jgi:hypothetical protein
MRFSRLSLSLLFLLLFILSTRGTARAASDESEDYDIQARVVRVSLLSGDVSLKRNGNTDWERGRLNFPLVEGDTVATDRDSRLELQFDGRNFVRLSSSSVLRIVTLRDEGVALSLIEGTALVRLAKFNQDKEYFEVDAPRTTMAAQKKGLYRIDAPREGRVRLTVRDGGSARIYSDTSGFVLRDGRTAELVFTGDNAGDWDFTAAGSFDGTDDWVNDRERYLAQRLRYDVQYYDEYVWGAEDLDSYGDWAYTTDFGWVWRPHSTVINIYDDWAPYRYGYWTWCQPYGWTWIGYEPWGWAPYHYGRWVYYNSGWVWCPRSEYYRHRSWWRPALVAFIHLDFGGSYCWYPLNYHQRDPRSRYYTQNPARLTALRADELANLRRVNPVALRAVTTASANQLGSDNLRARRADEALATRALATTPLRQLPARAPSQPDSGSGTTRPDAVLGRPTRVAPAIQPVERATGAATRSTGSQMDEELRRSRIFNNREPRQTVQPDGNSSTGGTVESRPTGALTRPAPTRGDSGDRSSGDRSPVDRRTVGNPTRPSVDDSTSPDNRPRATNSGEKRSRDEIRVAPMRNETGSEPSTPRSEAPASRSETSAPTRSEAPSRSEAPTRSEPAPRSEAPTRSEPAPRSEAPTRSEPAPRSEPRSEAPSRPSRPDNYQPPARVERSETPRSEPPRSEPPARSESPRSEPSRSETPRSEPTRSEPARTEAPRSESPRSEPRSESPRSSPETARPPKPDNDR